MSILIDNFNMLIDTPEKVDMLKSFILDLAFRGKLIKHDPTDEAVILKKIKNKKIKLGRKYKTTPINPNLEKLPENWKWEKIGDILEVIRGASPRPKGDPRYFGGTIPWIMISDITKEEGKYISRTIDTVTEEGAKKSRYLKAGTLILSNSGTVCVPKILKMNACIHDGFIAFPNINKNIEIVYLYYYFNYIRPYIIQENRQGVIQINLNTNIVRSIEIPIPPLNEQKRIIKKIEELFTILDSLSDIIIKKDEINANLRISLIENLRLSKNNEEIKTSVNNILKSFNELFNSKKDLEYFKDAILDLAVKGKLVEQDKKDEPAIKLLNKIKVEKEKLIHDRKIKKESLEPIDNENYPVLPDNWEYCKLGDLAKKITDGTHHTPTYVDNGIPFISVKDISGGTINFSNTKFISDEEHKELSKRCNPEFGDILLTKVGTTGIAKVVDTNREFSLFVSVALIKMFDNIISPYFLELVINSPFVKKQSEKGTRGVGNKNLVLRFIKNFVIPIPPYNEQMYILKKVDQIFEIINELEETTLQTEKYNKDLLTSILKSYIASDINSNIENKNIIKQKTLNSFNEPLKDKTGK